MAFFSESSLRLAGWWVQNRRKLREWRTIVFLAGVFFLLILDGVQLGSLAIGDRPLSTAVAARASRLTETVAAETPEALTVTTPIALPVSQNRFDLVARLHNPNSTWLAKTVAVHFTVGGKSAPALSTFLLPGGDRILLQSSVELPAGPSELTVDSVDWQRIPAHDPSLGISPFVVVSSALTPTTLSSGTPGTTATLVLKNQSVYGYRKLDVTVVVGQGSATLAAARTSAVNVRSGTTVPLTVTWAQSFPVGAQLSIDAVANPFDAGNRLPPGS